MVNFIDSQIKADAIYINGNIYTVDKNFSVEEAFAVKGDRFIDVSSNENIMKYADEKTKIVDLQQKTVLPGIIESHLHVDFIGVGKMEIDAHMKTKEEILEMVAGEYKIRKPGEWIKGDGWNNEIWDVRDFPTREDLDMVSPDIPVNLKRVCGHASWVNTKALELAGIDNNTKNPLGGEILRDKNGEATGIVTDQAQEFFLRVIPPLTEQQMERSALLAQKEFLKNGITTIHDAGSSEEVINRWERLYKKGELKVRKYVMFRVQGRPSYEELMDISGKYFKQGLKIGKYGNRLTVRCFKISSDGSMGARSAWMLDDYSDRPGHKGNGKLSDEEMYNVVKAAVSNGFQVAIHSIGDASNKQSLDVYEKVFNEIKNEDHRCRIEHAQVVAPEDIQRFIELNVIPSFQPIAVATDKIVAEERWGQERIKYAYAWRKFKNAGAKIMPISTDAPVDPINPFVNMYVAVTRKDLQGDPKNGWYKEEAFTRKEALEGATIMGAYAGFEENLKGSIEKGKLSDFIIIDKDYMNCEEEEIKDIKVLETVIGGETVYRI